MKKYETLKLTYNTDPEKFDIEEFVYDVIDLQAAGFKIYEVVLIKDEQILKLIIKKEL